MQRVNNLFSTFQRNLVGNIANNMDQDQTARLGVIFYARLVSCEIFLVWMLDLVFD